MAELALEARGLRKAYGVGDAAVSVLKGLDFSVSVGEYVAVLGPSGCGKSTLLNVLGLMDVPDSGEVSFRGRPASQMGEEERSHLRGEALGFIFQFDSLLPEFTILENVMMPARMAIAGGRSRESLAQARERALSLLRSLGLEPLQGRFPAQTSGGERQRAALCRALINRPALLLADEPTGNLDRPNGERVFQDLKDLAKEHGTAVVMVTHNEAACRWASRTVRMGDGLITEGAGPAWKIYIDGKYFSRTAAKVSVFDHGLLYGDGVFEGIRAYNGRILRLEDHLRRLKESADAIYLDLPLTPEHISDAVLGTVRANKLRDAYIRLLVTRGVGDLGLDMRKCRKGASLIIIADRIELYPAEFYERGLTLITSSYRQKRRDQVPATVKSLNYLLNVLARAEATRAGAQEAILLNAEGQVTECTGDNIFSVVDGQVFTPPVSAGILEGITRGLVMELVRDHLGREVVQGEMTVADLCRADEVFLTGTGAEVVPAVKIDGHTLGGGKAGPVTRRIISLFREHAQEHGTPVYPGKKKR